MSEGQEKRKVVLGITGSIAAYKGAEIARILISRGYEVRAVMTSSAQEFISPLTFEAITGAPVMTDFWESSERENIEHIDLADWADVVVVAPATADFIAKARAGFADTPLLATVLATKAPLLVAPAMNVNMYEHQVTQANVKALIDGGVHFVEPEEGELACGWKGTGRLADPWEIFYEIRKLLSDQDLRGRKILVTTGPTREAFDPVRFISNRSSGKMGVELAREAYRRGADVTLIHGPMEIKVPRGVEAIPVVTAEDMQGAVMGEVFEKDTTPDLVVMAAAVTDYKPASPADEKVKRSEQELTLKMLENDDILATVGEQRGEAKSPVLVGFAVETGEVDDLLDAVRGKLEQKKVDIIVGNFAHEAFESDTNRVWIVNKNGKHDEVAMTYKSRVAARILSAARKMF